MRKLLILLLRVNLAALASLLLIELAMGQPLSFGLMKSALIYALVYANATAVPAVLLFPGLLRRAGERGWALAPVVGLASAIFTATGCLLGEELLILLGVAPSGHFWSEYLHFLSFSILIAVLTSLGAFFYQSLKEQLREKTEALSQQGLSEERARKLAAEARLASLESRIRPHFLFNILNSISALIPTDPKGAEEMVGRLARLLRSSLDSSQHGLVPLQQELQMVRDYLDIEKARLGDKLQGRIEVPPDLFNVKVPPFSLQSLVENAIKHGIASQRNGGEFVIAVSAGSTTVHVEIQDSGPGFDLSKVAAGHGLDNLVSRLDTLFGGRACLNVLRRDARCVVEMVLPR
jgi:two-component system sensor histidine kinase AlgZ